MEPLGTARARKRRRRHLPDIVDPLGPRRGARLSSGVPGRDGRAGGDTTLRTTESVPRWKGSVLPAMRASRSTRRGATGRPFGDRLPFMAAR
jgi:hypothetical protein